MSYRHNVRDQILDAISDTLLPEQKQSLLLHNGVSQTLKLLKAPFEPILDCGTEVTFLRTSFPIIVQCLGLYFMLYLFYICCKCYRL